VSGQIESAFAALIENDTRFGYLDRHVESRRSVNPRLIVNNDSGTMLRALRDELRHASSFAFSVAFVTPRAIALLKQELVDFEGQGLIVTSNYLGFNSPLAFEELLALKSLGVDSRLHTSAAFHPKGYVFGYGDRVTAILGSSNLTEQALVANHEWNLRVSATRDSDLADQLDALVAAQIAESVELTQTWIRGYAEQYVVPKAAPRVAPPTTDLAIGGTPMPTSIPFASLDQDAPHLVEPRELPSVPAVEAIEVPLAPNAMQVEALAEIANLRASGAKKALVISATGTGKTILSALDVRAFAPKRLLFMVHREQILDRAIEEFQRVLGEPRDQFGKFTGTSRQADRRYVFATVQTLSQESVLARIDPREFDYVLVDEVHHAGASTYQRVLSHLRPEFTLGMTATPERNDAFNVFELFDFNVPYEIRLGRALENDMLAPFHYYGVADATFDDGSTIDIEDGLDRLASRIRVEHILNALDTYTQAGLPPKGLIFCSRVDEAHALAAALNESSLRGRVLRTVALSGSSSTVEREEAVVRLERGDLDYILTVDIFNEGVDIPAVNQVVMLRQTQSSIIFVQQLGRGLRKLEGKDYIVVIDFIGNYANNYMIPIALFGDDSLNKESLRQHLVSAEERGVLPGLSSVRFDRVSQKRVLDAIAAARLDSLQNIRKAFDTLRTRLGRVPDLRDFYRFESADPIVVATARGNYPALAAKFTGNSSALGAVESRLLTFLSSEAFDAKRPHELAVLRALIGHGPLSYVDLGAILRGDGLDASSSTIASAVRSLMLDFYTQQEQTRYVSPIAQRDGDLVRLTDSFLRSYGLNEAFASAVDDLTDTGLALIGARYDSAVPFTVGRQYTRKDACRLLGWTSNSSSTIYGYKVDKTTHTCPIFVTLHKSDHVSASTAYEDELLDRQNLRWFTRSRRTLASGEVDAIVNGRAVPHVFAKKDDAEGSAFYYLGRATPHEAVNSKMPGNSGESLDVVTMRLQFERPIESGIYDYFHPVVTD
jgi:superfamily II DNA or RNA helicase/HKD family nuclease